MSKKKSTETKPEAALASLPEETSTQAPAGSLESTPVVPMRKFNPYNRPAATQEPDPTPIRQTYEDIQREAKGPGSDQWRKADKLRADLTNFYNGLREDERYAQEYKSQRAWEEYQKVREQVEQLAPEARQKMQHSAEGLERMSIPTPEGEGLITKDTNKLLLTSNEYNRLQGLINRAEKQVEKIPGFKAKPVDVLKAEYERALDEGGPGGGATVRAVVQLARDYGHDIDSIVDGRRKSYHRESLAEAEQRRMRAQLVGKSVPQPPFPHPARMSQAPGRIGTYGGGQKTFSTPQQKAAFLPKRRKSHWG